LHEILTNEPGRKMLLMGNEAIARGALEAGLDLMAAYPGTPSSEIGEVLAAVAKDAGIHAEWSINEKIAFEVAVGASLVGARALVAMKNAGLNVAMDTFMTVPYGGVKGGLAVVVADDPNAHYSSNEQDTRLAAIYAEIPCLEPGDQQEAKDMTAAALEMSEEFELPVFVRSASRLSHASGDVALGKLPERQKRELGFNKHWKLPYRWNVYGSPGALSKHRWLHERLDMVRESAAGSSFSNLVLTRGAKLGVIASGLAASYVREALARLGVESNLLTIGMVYPLPEAKVRELLEASERVLVLEEGDQAVETQVRALAQAAGCSVPILGRYHRNAVLEPYGELNPDRARRAVLGALEGLRGATGGAGVDASSGAPAPGARTSSATAARAEAKKRARAMVVPRSSALCAGCSHLGSYWAVREALRRRKGVHIVNGDIGCYEQGGYGLLSSRIDAGPEASRRWPLKSPYEILDTNYVMGGGIGLAQGQAQAGYRDGKVLAVAGDSTYAHATIPSLLNAVYNRADFTFLILANNWTAMTGHQPNPTTGVDAVGDQAPLLDIIASAKSLGVEHISQASAYDLAAAKEAISGALDHEEPSVVVLTGECQLQVQRRSPVRSPRTRVDEEECTGCGICLQLGCPAVTFDPDKKKAGIDTSLCVDCDLCRQVCPTGAIGTEDQ